MTRKVLAGIVAGAFALGTLTGSAGAIVVNYAATPWTDMTAVTVGHMSGAMISGAMMSGDMMPGGMMGPGASGMPGNQHDQHHTSPSPEPSK